MPDDRGKLKKLHDNLVNQGYELPDFATFEKDMADPTKLTKLHTTLKNDGYDLPDYPTFKVDMGYPDEVKKKDWISSAFGGLGEYTAGNRPSSSAGFSRLGAAAIAKMPKTEEQEIRQALKGVKSYPATQQELDKSNLEIEGFENDPLGSFLKPIKTRQAELRNLRQGVESVGQDAIARMRDSKEISKLVNDEKDLMGQRFNHSLEAKGFLEDKLDPSKLKLKEGVEVGFNTPQPTIDDYTEESLQEALPFGNLTAKIALGQYQKNKKIREVINGAATIEDAAIQSEVNKNTLPGQQATKLRGELPNNMKGNIVLNFINDPDVQEVARENPELAQKIMSEAQQFPEKYPEAAVRMLAEIISKAREERGDNKAILNITSAKTSDKIVEELFEKGEIPENYKKFYERPEVRFSVNKSLKTPGLIENFGTSLGEGIMGIGKSVADVTGVRDLYSNTPDRLYSTLEKQYQDFSFKPKGLIHNLTTYGGQVTGQVAPLMVGGGVMRGLGLVKGERTANALMAGLQTFGENRDRALADLPNASEAEQFGYATINTGVEIALANVLNDAKLARDLVRGASPEIKSIIQRFTKKEITESAAKEGVENIFGRALKTAGKFVKGQQKTAFKETGEEVGTHVLQRANNQVFGGEKQSDAQEAEDMFKVAITTLLGSQFLGAGGGVVEINKNPEMGKVIYDMASKPEQYIEVMKGQAATDPEYAKDIDQKLDNLQYIVDVKKELDGRNMKEDDKAKFLLKSLSEKMLTEKTKAVPDKSLNKEAEKQLAEIEISKRKLLDPDISNTDLITEFYDEEILPKGHMSMLETEGKFNEANVGRYLKFVAQQANGLDENWQPAGNAPSMEKVPQDVVDIANERWKKEIKDAKPLPVIEIEPDQKSEPVELSTDLPVDYQLPDQLKMEQEVNIPNLPSNEQGGKSNIEKRLFDEYGDLYKRIELIRESMPEVVIDANSFPRDISKMKEAFKPIVDEIKKETGKDTITLYRAEVKGENDNLPVSSWTSQQFVADAFRDRPDLTGEKNTKGYEVVKKEIPLDNIVAIKNTIYGEGFFTKERSSQYEFIVENKNNETSDEPTKEAKPVEPKEEIITETVIDKGGEPPKEGETVVGTTEPPKGPPKEKAAGIYSEQPPFTLVKEELNRVREQMGLDEFEGKRVSNLEAVTKAQDTITEWKEKGTYQREIDKIIDDAMNEKISDEGQNILAQHIADLRVTKATIKDRNSPEYDKVLQEINKAVDAGDVLRSAAGRILGRNDLKMRGKALDNITDIELDMMGDYGVDVLTKEQKAEAEARFNEVTAKFEAERDLREKAEAEIERLKAEKEIGKAKRNAPAKKKTSEEYKKERADLISSIKDKWNKAGKDTLSSDLPYRKQLAAISGDVAKLIGNYLEQGLATTLEGVRGLLKKDIQESGIDITDSDVRKLIAGEFNERKSTRNELVTKVQHLRTEEKLLLKLDALESGEVPKDNKKQIVRNQRLKGIRDAIDEFYKKNKLGKYSDKEKFEQALKQRISQNKNKQKEIEEKIKNKDFADEVKEGSILENTELQKNNPKLYKEYLKSVVDKDKAVIDYEKKRLDDKIKNHSFVEKGADIVHIALTTSKGAVAMFDQSGVLVQMLPATLSHPWQVAKNLPSAIRDLFDNKWFDRRMAKLKSTKLWDIIEKSDLAIYDPQGMSDNVRNEMLGGRKNLLNRDITIGGKKTSIGKAFERSTSNLFNNMRLFLFESAVDKLATQGKTFESRPEEYKSAARAINEWTGHGKVQKHLAQATPIINKIVWSPKMMASTFNILGLGDLIRPAVTAKEIGKSLGIKGLKDNPEAVKGFYSSLTPKQRAFMRWEILRAITTAATVIIAGRLTGVADDQDLDPISVGFGNMKIGNKDVNVFGRFGKTFSALSQVALGKRRIDGEIDILGDKYGDKNAFDVLYGSQGRGKMTPAAGLAHDLILNKQKNFYTREPITPLGVLKQMTVPLSFQDMAKDLRRDGAFKGTLWTLLKLYGGNARDERDFEKKDSDNSRTRENRAREPRQRERVKRD